ncbi:MAG: DUF3800 domain-containing protein [Acidobacteriota bacterium]
MPHSFDICIDESGDQGFSFHKPDCSHWFVLSGVISLRARTEEMTSLIRSAKQSLNWQEKQHLHFKDVKIDRREELIQTLIQDASLFRAIVVMVHKPSLHSPEKFKEENRLYFYFTRFLLERASRLCRDHPQRHDKNMGDGSARVIFSKMNEISHKRIQRYFGDLRGIQTSIDWDVIKDTQFETLSPTKHAGLQIADSVAGGFFCGDHPVQKKQSPRWCQMFKPMLYTGRDGEHRGYGLKIFPKEAETRIAQGTMSAWAMTHYPV